MNEDIRQSDICTLADTEIQGGTRLCCCYAMDENGNFVDPCYRPAMESGGGRCRLFERQLKANNPT